MDARVSIALCTYNGAPYLLEQLQSFCLQTRLPDELIVCDDGSTDDTLRILDDFARNAPFLVQTYTNDHNLGYARNFEKAVSLCTGDIIFLSDQDDVWSVSKVEKVYDRFLLDRRLELVFTDAELVNENLEPIGINLF